MLLLGFAWQRGLVPVSLDALMTAIELNGVAVAMNRSAFALGRLAAHEPDSARLKTAANRRPRSPEDFEAKLRSRAAFLTAYQDARYAAPVRGTGAQGGRSRGAFRAWPVRLCRCGSGRRVQADGVQGRVRGRPALRGAGIQGEARRNFRRDAEAQVPPCAAAAVPDRSANGASGQDRVRAVDARRVQGCSRG